MKSNNFQLCAWIYHIMHCDYKKINHWSVLGLEISVMYQARIMKRLSKRYFCKLITLLVNLKLMIFKKSRFLNKKKLLFFSFICLEKVACLTVYIGKIRHWDIIKWSFGLLLKVTAVGIFFDESLTLILAGTSSTGRKSCYKYHWIYL